VIRTTLSDELERVAAGARISEPELAAELDALREAWEAAVAACALAGCPGSTKIMLDVSRRAYARLAELEAV
jgi:hypothetical protein